MTLDFQDDLQRFLTVSVHCTCSNKTVEIIKLLLVNFDKTERCFLAIRASFLQVLTESSSLLLLLPVAEHLLQALLQSLFFPSVFPQWLVLSRCLKTWPCVNRWAVHKAQIPTALPDFIQPASLKTRKGFKILLPPPMLGCTGEQGKSQGPNVYLKIVNLSSVIERSYTTVIVWPLSFWRCQSSVTSP